MHKRYSNRYNMLSRFLIVTYKVLICNKSVAEKQSVAVEIIKT